MRRAIPLIMFVLMEITLISLGVWQLQRKEWKEALLENIQQNQTAPVLILKDSTLISKDMLFRRVALTCHYDAFESAFELGFDERSQIAERAYHLCDFKNAPSLVLRENWIPKKQAAIVLGKETVLISQPRRPGDTKPMVINVTGRLYPWTKESFYSSWVRDVEYDQKNFWQFFRKSNIADYFVQEGDALPPPPPNNHFAYAMQWFIFAGVLLVIFTIWWRRQGVAPSPPAA